jgi:flagellar hook-length control protein FliK
VPISFLAETGKADTGTSVAISKLNDNAIIGTEVELPATVKTPKTALPDAKITSPFVPVAPRLDDPIQFANSILDMPASFGAISLATMPAATPQSTIGPLPPLPIPPPPILPAAVSPTIVDMVQTWNDGPLELALSPEELGRLTISIKHDGDFVRVTVIADRPETLDLMRRHGGDLVADLRQAGFSGASLSFGQGGQGGQPRFANAETLTKNQPAPQHLPPETKPMAPSRSRKGSGVDLRF